MPDKQAIGKAVAYLADCCAAFAGDFHTMHLNFKGHEFDNYHKKVLQEYYDQLNEDYDGLAEWARCYDVLAENVNGSAGRVENFYSYEGVCTRESVVQETHERLEKLLQTFNNVLKLLNKIEDCVISVGLANWLQDRIQYWAKECYYFNAGRVNT
jgi:DNA-binding ferritin-like protein